MTLSGFFPAIAGQDDSVFRHGRSGGRQKYREIRSKALWAGAFSRAERQAGSATGDAVGNGGFGNRS
jgi:hypothetical protein